MLRQLGNLIGDPVDVTTLLLTCKYTTPRPVTREKLQGVPSSRQRLNFATQSSADTAE